MTHARFYLPPAQWSGETLELGGEEARHCVQVTRHREGDTISIFDGCGRVAAGPILSAGKDVVRLQVQSLATVPAPEHPLTLLQGLVKGDTMDWIIEKAVELGVRQIVPVIAQRSIVRLNAADAAKKREKWQRVALEACKQCGQSWLPQVSLPVSVEQAVADAASHQLKLTTSLASDAQPLRQLLTSPPSGACAVAIGPEGDFSPEEYQVFRNNSWQSWSLGGLTLRSETAAICALSILSYELRSS